MKTKEQVIQDILRDDNPDTFEVMMSSNLIKIAMEEYAKAVINDILEDPSMIYYDGTEAVYSYEAFEKYKEQL